MTLISVFGSHTPYYFYTAFPMLSRLDIREFSEIKEHGRICLFKVFISTEHYNNN